MVYKNFSKNSINYSLLLTAQSDSLLSSVCTVPLFVCSSASATLDNTLFPDVEFVALLVPTLSGRSQAVKIGSTIPDQINFSVALKWAL